MDGKLGGAWGLGEFYASGMKQVLRCARMTKNKEIAKSSRVNDLQSWGDADPSLRSG